jgi:hypothetical protein
MSFWKLFFSSLFRPDDFKLFLLAFGLFFTVLGIRAFWIYFQNPQTVVVRGQVIRSKERLGTNPHRPSTSFDFSYQYQYRGKTYTSSRYHYKTEGGHAQAVARYRAGDAISVFLDPEHPEQAVIEKGWSWLNLIWIVVGLAIVYKVLSMHAYLTRQEFLQQE